LYYEKPQNISFIVAGARRSGHASIRHALSQHPRLQLIEDRHQGYFAKDDLYERGNPLIPYDDQLYASDTPLLVTGEVTNAYLHHPTAISRIYRYNPSIKMIVILRNPAERTYSHWQEATNQGLENRSWEQAINDELESSDNSILYQSTLKGSYLCSSRYGNQIQHLLQYLNPHQLLFIKSEDLRDDIEVMLYQIFQFLHVPYLDVDTSAQNLGDYHSSLNAESYNEIISAVQDDIELTEAMLGWNCDDWKQQRSVPINELIFS